MNGVRISDTEKKGVRNKNIWNNKRKHETWKQHISKSTLFNKRHSRNYCNYYKEIKNCLILHQQNAKNRKKKAPFSSFSSWEKSCWRMDSALYWGNFFQYPNFNKRIHIRMLVDRTRFLTLVICLADEGAFSALSTIYYLRHSANAAHLLLCQFSSRMCSGLSLICIYAQTEHIQFYYI